MVSAPQQHNGANRDDRTMTVKSVLSIVSSSELFAPHSLGHPGFSVAMPTLSHSFHGLTAATSIIIVVTLFSYVLGRSVRLLELQPQMEFTLLRAGTSGAASSAGTWLA
jgi:hypothetical protein